jgi:hypothetical protein
MVISAGRSLKILFSLAVIILTALLIVPLTPFMPISGLDGSWGYALNEAVASHLVFGRDIIFTFGPLASIDMKLYHPSTDIIMIAGSLLVAAGLCAGFSVLVGQKRLFLLAFLPIIVAESASMDTLLMALPFLLVLVVINLALKQKKDGRTSVSFCERFCIGILTCAIAILPQIKGTFASLAFVEGGLAVLIAVIDRRIFLAAAITIIACMVLTASWISVGQPLAALPDFFLSQGPIVAGYSEAMSISGPNSAVLYWSFTAVLIFILFYSHIIRKAGWIGWLALLGLLFYLFVSFKAGFVRQDGHSLISAATFLFVMLYLVPLLDIKSSIAVVLIALFGWGAIERTVAPFDLQTAYTRLKSPIAAIPAGLDLRLNGAKTLRGMFGRANVSIRSESPLPPVTGTADIYPYDLAALFGNGISWSGRPIPQSYAAYTPVLEAKNAAHLSAPNAPDIIFFSIAPADDRLPALEDAASWPIILTHYVPIQTWEKYIEMKRANKPTDFHYNNLTTISGFINEKLDLPNSYNNTWVSIHMKPTLLGRIVLTLFRLPYVYAELTLEDGSVVRHRYIPEMGQAGFLLSPYIASASEFIRIGLLTTKSHYVKSFKLITSDTGLWQKDMSISYSAIDIEPQPGAREFLITHPSPNPEVITSVVENINAECSIDFIDDKLASSHPDPFRIDTDIVPIRGWAAPSVTQGIAPDETWVVLTGDNGDKHFYRSKIQSRKDVNLYLQHSEMADIGFNANLDISGITGRQTITIYLLKDRKGYSCPSHPILLIVTHPSPRPEAFTSVVESINAECSIDFIDDKLLSSHPDPFEISTDIVPIRGWAAPSVTRGVAPDETWVSLTDADGNQHFYKSNLQPRKDVTTYFHHSDMRDVGFNLNLDLSGLKGRQKVTIYSLKDGKVYTCPTQPILLLQ